MKSWIKNLRVRKKILLIISINVFFTALMTIISHQSLNKVDEIKADIVQVGKAASRQLTADMMHDALRADVYNAFLTLRTDKAASKSVLKDFNEHVGIFKTSLNELKNFQVADKIKQQVNLINGPLNDYIISSGHLITKGLYSNFGLHTVQGEKEMHAYKNTFDRLAVQMEALSEKIEKEYTHQQDVLTEYTHQIQLILFLLGIVVAVIALLLSLYVSKLIEKPILITEEVLGKISSGEITETFEVEGKDETAQMLRSLNTVVDNLSNVKQFVSEVGKGNFEVEVDIFQNNGEIYESLHSMTDAIKANVEEDRKRNWTSEGLAKFVDITRDIQDIEVFYNNILSNLIRYVNANQGYLYVVNDEHDEPFMEVQAVYAYGKQRYLEEKKEIKFKQGLVGQAWFDKEPLYFTEIPMDFVNITSGMGEATPTCVFIVPLMINERVLGMLEIATFSEMQKHEKEFIVKLSETIASTVDSAKTNDRTRKLLIASQEAEQNMKAQEEEIRQNMEEMQATQAEMERMQRKMVEDKNALQKEFDAKSAEQVGVIEGINATMATIEFTPSGDVVNANQNFLDAMQCELTDIVGKNHRIFVLEDDRNSEEYQAFWPNLALGIPFQGEIQRLDHHGEVVWLNAIYKPLKDEQGSVVKVMKFALNITSQKKKEIELQEILAQSKKQEEEIRTNMEMMMATQEEMGIVQREMEVQKELVDSVALVAKFNMKGNMTYVNDNFMKLTNYSLKELLFKEFNMLKPEDEDGMLIDKMWESVLAGLKVKNKIKLKLKDGSFSWFEMLIAPITDEMGKPQGYLSQLYPIK
jgi:PAS domain S-box-containing protein